MLTTAPASEERRVGPVSIRATTVARAVAEIVSASARRQPLQIAFGNTHLLYCALQDKSFARLLRNFQILNDGVGIDLVARIAGGGSFPENLNGTDLTPRLLAALPAGTTVYFLGAAPDVVASAAARARTLWPHLSICAARDGYKQLDVGLAEIAWLKPDLVLVAMGNPLQEQWIARCAEQAGGIYLGVGALFDFLADAVPRAPPGWRALRLEWLFRLLREPRRLWRRYTLETIVVFFEVLRGKVRGGRA